MADSDITEALSCAMKVSTFQSSTGGNLLRNPIHQVFWEEGQIYVNTAGTGQSRGHSVQIVMAADIGDVLNKYRDERLAAEQIGREKRWKEIERTARTLLAKVWAAGTAWETERWELRHALDDML